VTLRSATDTDEIISFCRESLIAYKMPAHVIVLDSMPLTPAGKVDRIKLQNSLKETA
jgi:acyl-CoA synthetase (AMP-forming)/AMP-acid ligase II